MFDRSTRGRGAGRAWLRWLPTFLTFPIGGSLAFAVVGPVDDTPAALLGGGLTGLVLGIGQALALRPHVPTAAWVGASVVGLAVGLAIATAAVAYGTGPTELALQGAICGLVLGGAQSVVLRGRLTDPWRWMLLAAVAWALGWTVTRAVGVDVAAHWTVFGSSGALVATALTGLLPVVLSARPAPGDSRIAAAT